MVNVLLGSVLWTTYSQASDVFEPHIRSPIALAAVSGAIAGGAQALLAAPALGPPQARDPVRVRVEAFRVSRRAAMTWMVLRRVLSFVVFGPSLCFVF